MFTRRSALIAGALSLPAVVMSPSRALGSLHTQHRTNAQTAKPEPRWDEYRLRQGRVYAVHTGLTRQKPIIVFHHGADATAASVRADPVQNALITALASTGYLVMVSDFGGTLWGNDLNHRYIDALISRAHRLGGQRGPVGLIGVSMGGGATISWAGLNPHRTAFVVGIVPALDLTSVNVIFPGRVDEAYDGSYSDQRYGKRSSPVVMARTRSTLTPKNKSSSRFTQTPVGIWWAREDTICLPRYVQQFAARTRSRRGARLHLKSVPGDHALDEFTAPVRRDIVRYARQHLPV